ncbi:hypothetical protein M3Y99_01362800 [Aphelenchoides fujianensis]|nr:hypothetical protein M3Y99_01362800 [Aphelenchoides fujianensis]
MQPPASSSQFNGNMNGMPQNMGPRPACRQWAPMPPPHLQRGGPNGLDGVIGWMMQDAPPPAPGNPPPANNGEDDVIVLDDDSTEERSDLSVLSSAVSLIVPPAFAFANMNDRIVSPAKFVSKLQQFFTVSLRPVHPDSFVLKLQLRVWGVNERQEEQFRYVCLRDINDLGHVYLGRRMDCCQLKKIFCHLDVASNQERDRADRSLSFAFERLETFRERTLGFVVANLREVRRLSGWKQFSNDHPEISTEILDRIKL